MQKLHPRSPYEKLGGYVHLPRLIDKARLYRKGLLNGYNYKTVGFDKHLLAFLKLNGDDFEEIANRFDNDAEVLTWVDKNESKIPPIRSDLGIGQVTRRIQIPAPNATGFEIVCK